MKRSIKGFSILLLLVVLPGCQEETPQKEMIRMVRAVQVSDPAEFTQRWFPGQAKATQEVDLSFRVAGPLIERPVNVGDNLPKGQKVARIDPRDFETRIAGIESRIGEAKAQLAAMETGARPEDLAILEAEVEAAEAVRLNAEQQYLRYRDLYVKRQVSTAHTCRVQIPAETIQQALSVLSTIRGVKVGLCPGRQDELLVSTSDQSGPADMNVVLDRLIRSGVPIQSFSRDSVHLSDAFLSMTEEAQQ